MEQSLGAVDKQSEHDSDKHPESPEVPQHVNRGLPFTDDGGVSWAGGNRNGEGQETDFLNILEMGCFSDGV